MSILMQTFLPTLSAFFAYHFASHRLMLLLLLSYCCCRWVGGCFAVRVGAVSDERILFKFTKLTTRPASRQAAKPILGTTAATTTTRKSNNNTNTYNALAVHRSGNKSRKMCQSGSYFRYGVFAFAVS